MPSAEGNLTWKPLAEHPELVAPPVAAAAANSWQDTQPPIPNNVLS